jgi:hypothetical protein
MGRDETGSDVRSNTPLWVKISGLLVLVLVVAFVVVLIIGSGHRPGRHAGASGSLAIAFA